MSLSFWQGVSTWVFALQLLVVSALVWGYFTCFEGLRRGQTPGKRWLGIRVIRDTGLAVSFADAAVRNLLLPADWFALAGAFFIALHPKAKRLGDLVAGTVVVRDQPAQVARPVPARTAGAAHPVDDAALGSPLFSDAEFRVLREWQQRAPELPEAVRIRLGAELAGRFAGRFPERQDPGDLEFLARLYREEQARRQGRFGARAAGGGSVAERLVARKTSRWEEFQQLADRVSTGGLGALEPAELAGFAARYREVAADLARARTYGADPVVRVRLERLAAAGHNALYQKNRHTWRRLWRLLSRECPAAVLAARRPVTLAFLVFMLPAAGGFLLLRERPGLAPELLPDTMLERSEAGASRTRQGERYVESPVGERPLVASAIIANNVRVAFACFAGGIFLGVGSLLLLALNGLELGAISGHFANTGLLGYLWTFVVGHGVLELFAIWVAGAAGFLLGLAVIAPGDLSRKDALVLAGRRAIRMIGFVVVLLLVAGTIEGFVSSSQWPLAGRLIISSASVLFLILYLLNGLRATLATFE